MARLGVKSAAIAASGLAGGVVLMGLAPYAFVYVVYLVSLPPGTVGGGQTGLLLLTLVLR